MILEDLFENNDVCPKTSYWSLCAIFVHFHGDQDQDQDQMHMKVYSLSGALVEVLGDLPAPPPLLHLRPTHHGHQQQAGYQALHLTNLEFTKLPK